jgi:hypothetical protein
LYKRAALTSSQAELSQGKAGIGGSLVKPQGCNVIGGKAPEPFFIENSELNCGERVAHPVRPVELHPCGIVVLGGEIGPAKLRGDPII